MSKLLQMPFKMLSYSFPSYSRERYDWSHSINMEMKTVISVLSPVYSGCLKEGKTARSSTNGAELICFVPHIHKPFLLMKSKKKLNIKEKSELGCSSYLGRRVGGSSGAQFICLNSAFMPVF